MLQLGDIGQATAGQMRGAAGSVQPGKKRRSPPDVETRESGLFHCHVRAFAEMNWTLGEINLRILEVSGQTRVHTHGSWAAAAGIYPPPCCALPPPLWDFTSAIVTMSHSSGATEHPLPMCV